MRAPAQALRLAGRISDGNTTSNRLSPNGTTDLKGSQRASSFIKLPPSIVEFFQAGPLPAQGESMSARYGFKAPVHRPSRRAACYCEQHETANPTCRRGGRLRHLPLSTA